MSRIPKNEVSRLSANCTNVEVATFTPPLASEKYYIYITKLNDLKIIICLRKSKKIQFVKSLKNWCCMADIVFYGPIPMTS